MVERIPRYPKIAFSSKLQFKVALSKILNRKNTSFEQAVPAATT